MLLVSTVLLDSVVLMLHENPQSLSCRNITRIHVMAQNYANTKHDSKLTYGRVIDRTVTEKCLYK